jgi:hypothetical protein
MLLHPDSHNSICGPYKYQPPDFPAEAARQDKDHVITPSRQRKGVKKTGMLTWFMYTLRILSHIQMVGNSSTQPYKTSPSLTTAKHASNDTGIAASIDQALSNILPHQHDYSGRAEIRPEALHFLRSQNDIADEENAHPIQHHAAASAPSSTSGFLQFPMAQATVAAPPADAVSWNARHHFFTITDDTEKGNLIKELVSILVKIGNVTQDQADRYEFQWKQRIAGKTLYLIPENTLDTFTIEKRKSFKDIDKDIAEHIKKNCAFETEIVDLKGRTVAELQIFKLQKIEKMLESPASTLAHYLGKELSSSTASVLDTISLILFSPNMDIPKGMIQIMRTFYTRQHYVQTDDDICLIRQNRYALGTIATNLEVAGLGQFQLQKNALKRPSELQRIHSLDSNAIYYARNKQTGTKTELIMKAQTNRDRINQVDKVIIKEKGPENYVASRISHGNSKPIEIPIVFDDAAEIWREALPPHLPLLNVEFQSGRTFVMIRGKQYPLRMTQHMQYQITVKHLNGITEFLPVYRDKVSKSWHLEVADNHPVFSPRAKVLITQLKIEHDQSKHFEIIANEHPEYYGDGKLIQIRNHPDGPIINTVVEMNGELIPVRKTSLRHHCCRYDVFDIEFPYKAGYPIVWDGEHWNIEHPTSPHLSKELKQLITTDMYVRDLTPSTLSAADKRGLRWSQDNNAYIKFKNRFLRLYPESHSSLKMRSGERIAVIYSDGQFRPTTPPAAPRITVHVDGKTHTEFMPSEPGSVPVHTDEMITRNFNSMFKYMLENYWVPGIQEINLLDAIQRYFPNEDIQVERIPSDKLNTIRFIATVGNEQYVLETSPNGGNTTTRLVGEELKNALSKYKKRRLGGEIPHVIGLTNENIAVAIARTPYDIAMITRKRIQAGRAEIKTILERLPSTGEGITLVVGNNDFLGLGSFATNACAPPKVAYQALVDFFLELSRDHPDVIIVPGYFPISEDIPEAIRAKELVYQRDHQEFQVKQAVHFTAVIAPVFFNGKIVTFARKGDYLAYQTADQHDNGKMQTVNLGDLDVSIPAQKHLVSRDDNEDNFIQPIDLLHHREGTIFAGKTLLPGERDLTESLLRPHMADNATRDFFQNRFVIGEEKFLLVIGNEFKSTRNFRPSIRTQALPGNDAGIPGVSFDWIIHISAGEALDPQMTSTAYSYLQVGNDGNNQYLSDFVERTHSIQTFSTSDLLVHQYDLDTTDAPSADLAERN